MTHRDRGLTAPEHLHGDALPGLLRRALRWFGLDERRCAVCLTPFTPPLHHANMYSACRTMPAGAPAASVAAGLHKAMPAAATPTRTQDTHAHGPTATTDPLALPGLEPEGVPIPWPSLYPDICPDCLALMPRRMQGYCPRCGEPFAVATLPCAPCGQCLITPPPWDQFRFHGVYENLTRQLLLRAKFGVEHATLRALGTLLAHCCADLPRPDVIIPMPLHPTRLLQRGANQAQELARPVAALLGAPLRADLLTRTVPSRPQTGLSRAERTRNLRNAFTAVPEVQDKTLLLIDDTMTTGTSLRRAVNALLQQGAHAVHVAVVGRTAIRDTTARAANPHGQAVP